MQVFLWNKARCVENATEFVRLPLFMKRDRSNARNQRSHCPTTTIYKMTIHHRNGIAEQSLFIKILQTFCFRFLLLLIIPLLLIQIVKIFTIESIDLLSYESDFDIRDNDSILCGGCFFAKTDDGITCGHYIRQHVFQSLFNLSHSSDTENETKTETTEEEKWSKIQQMQIFNKTLYTQIVRNAAYKASVDYPYVCSHCDPASCTQRSKKGDASRSGTIYHSYDVAAPKVQQTWSPFLKSIPADNRYPMEGIENPEQYLSNPKNTEKIYYSEFNPSIIAIPDHERIHSFIHPTTGIATTPVYLVSFRVSQYFLCMGFGSPHNLKLSHKNEKELMGLAFLDENFVVLADAVYKTEEEDIRLVTLPSPYDNNKLQIYLTYCTLQTHGWLSFRRAIQRELRLKKPPVNLHYEARNPLYVDSANPMMPPIYIHSYPNCLTVSDAFIDAKNIVYFADATISSETTLDLFENGVNYTKTNMSTPVIVAENWPPQNDRTHKVSFIEANNRRWCPASATFRKTDGELVSGNETRTNENRTSTIQPSFYTMEEQLYGDNLISHVAPWESDRGNACCIEMINPRTNLTVLVGLSHAKLDTMDSDAYKMMPDTYQSAYRASNNAYLSRFYAFEPTRPYRTVALSGHFCWPIITSNIGNLSNHFANVGEKLQFVQSINQTNQTNQTSTRTGWCPTIHFVMSLLYKVNTNKSSVIISFGVNDCTPRFIEVLTSDITELLFYGITSQL